MAILEKILKSIQDKKTQGIKPKVIILTDKQREELNNRLLETIGVKETEAFLESQKILGCHIIDDKNQIITL